LSVLESALINWKVLLAWENESCLESRSAKVRSTFQVKGTSWSQGLSVTADGEGLVPLAGAVAVRLLADRVGLTAGLSAALARRGFAPGHVRGQVWVDVAMMLTAGGEAIADIDTLRHQGDLLGPVASAPTVWRTLDEATPAMLKRVEKARARTRQHVWGLVPQLPVSKVAGTDLGDVVVLDVDATLVTAHSEKELAKATFEGGFGFHPIGVWCDNTTELLAATLRPGNAGSNHAGDHIDVIGRAITQIPPACRGRLLVRADGAGATHELLDWLTAQGQVRGRRLEYSVGFPTKNVALTSAITTVPERAWTPALDAGGEIRGGADVVEVTGLLDLRRWPEGMRVILRRERPHPGAQLSLLEEADGWRYQAFATNTIAGQLGFLEARHRAHARVEDRIRAAKDSGLSRLPSREFKINQAWLQLVAVAADLTAWLRLLALTGDLAVVEPKLLRFRMLHVPARLSRGSRRRRLRLPQHWPWADQILEAFRRIMIIPAPT
jgi:DDE family transposase